jgi:hypothetical protein
MEILICPFNTDLVFFLARIGELIFSEHISFMPI